MNQGDLSGGNNHNSDRKNKLFLFFKIFISVLLIVYLYTSVKFTETLSTLRLANPYLIILTLILVAPNIYLQFIKWKIICRNILREESNRVIWLSLFYGYSGGIATPFRLGEYVGRTMAFGNKGILEISAATLVDILFVLFTVTFTGAIATVIFLQTYYGMGIGYAVLLYSVLAFFYTFIFFIAGRKELFQNRIVKWGTKIKYIDEFFKTLWSFKTLSRRNIFYLVITTVILCGVYIFQFALLVAAYSNHNELLQFFFAGLLVMFFKTIIPPVTLGELGVREGASVFFLTKMGLNSAMALNASLTLFAFNILLPSLTGLFLVLSRRNSGN